MEPFFMISKVVECPFVPTFSSDTNDPEPVDKSESSGESATVEEPPEPVDIDRQSR
jgi:hypothetical protein